MRDILLDAPQLQVALALTLVVAAAALLYRMDRGNRHLNGGLRAVLGLVRAATLMVLVLLLFRPVLRIEESETRQPALIVLQDQSQSVGADNPDWALQLGAWLAALPADEGEPGADVHIYGFGADVVPVQGPDSLAFEDPITDLATALDVIQGQWSGAPVGGIVVASDGRFNRGRNPETVGKRISAPLHTIALGDTSLIKDVSILRLLHNDVARLGNTFPIEVEVGSQGFKGRTTVRLNGEGINRSEEVAFDGSGAPRTVRFLVPAEKAGIQRYRVSIDGAEGEENLDNNRRTALIDVIEGRKRILITGPAPHPDQGAWANALSGNINHEVAIMPLEDVPGSEPWDAAFMFSFDPGSSLARTAYGALNASGVPVGLILDPNAGLGELASLGIGLDFTVARSGLTTDPRGGVNPAFPHFRVMEGMEEWLAEVPPLMAPFGTAEWGPAHTPLLVQRIGGITTADPLLTVTQTAERRGMVLLGEGSWRWRQVGYLRSGSHEMFDDLVGKIAQFLTSDPGADRFRVDAPRILDEDQRLNMQARAYDATLQPFAEADIALTLTDSAGTRFNYRFSAEPAGGFSLDAGRWPKGTYTWSASTDIGGTRFERNGILEIRAMELERSGRPADHAILKRMSIGAGGITAMPNDLDSLTAVLSSSGRFTPERDLSERLQDIIQWKTLLWMLLGLLSVEWIVRRWAGTY